MIRPVLSLACLVLWGLLLAPFQWLSVKLNLKTQLLIPVLFHRYGLPMIGVRVRQVGQAADMRPLLICSNHVSWLDIPVLGSLLPLSFVSKADVGRWPVFGTLARLQRSVFIDRGRRAATQGATHEIVERLNAGEIMVIFPEGTTGDGNHILKFRSSLLGAVQQAMFDRLFIQPVSIRYRGLHGLPMGRGFQPYAAWYGDMDLVPHFLDILKLGAIEVEVQFGEAYALAPDRDRKEMAAEAEKAVRDLHNGLKPKEDAREGAGA